MCYVWNALARIHVLHLLMYPQRLHPSQLCLRELAGLWQQGSKQDTNEPWEWPPSKQVSKTSTATSQGATCVTSGARRSCASLLSNAVMANALVSRRVMLWCCWAQLAVRSAEESEREPTRSLQLCFPIKGKLKAQANFVTAFFYGTFESEWTH